VAERPNFLVRIRLTKRAFLPPLISAGFDSGTAKAGGESSRLTSSVTGSFGVVTVPSIASRLSRSSTCSLGLLGFDASSSTGATLLPVFGWGLDIIILAVY
jgi:hypothetical protein